MRFLQIICNILEITAKLAKYIFLTRFLTEKSGNLGGWSLHAGKNMRVSEKDGWVGG